MNGAEGAKLLAGTPYRFVRRLGRGAMGVVLEADHEGLRRRLCVKVLDPTHADDPGALADRFRLEAQALARLDHPNIVRVSDFGTTADGRPYLAMALLGGDTLDQVLKQRRLTQTETRSLTKQLLAGLHAAHKLGIVHRDIKPANLFFTPPADGATEPTLTILDFGLSKVFRKSTALADVPSLASPTQDGLALGTPRYFAPEQAKGGEIDARTDLYAAALVLYKMLVGRGPFDEHRSLLDIVRAHLTETPRPPSAFAGEEAVHPAVDRVVLTALEKDPDRRYPDAISFSESLDGAFRLADVAAGRRSMPSLGGTELLGAGTAAGSSALAGTAPLGAGPLPLPTVTPKPTVKMKPARPHTEKLGEGAAIEVPAPPAGDIDAAAAAAFVGSSGATPPPARSRSGAALVALLVVGIGVAVGGYLVFGRKAPVREDDSARSSELVAKETPPEASTSPTAEASTSASQPPPETPSAEPELAPVPAKTSGAPNPSPPPPPPPADDGRLF